MAGFENLKYHCDSDSFVLPNGKRISGLTVYLAKKKMQDLCDVADGYDPYNHRGKLVTGTKK